MSAKNVVAPLISVVIPVYRTGEVLRKTLDALLNVDYPKEKIEIIFSYYPDPDDSLTPNIIKEFRRRNRNKYFGIKVLKREKQGTSYGRNLGIKNSNGDYIFVLDDDIIIHRDTFKHALKLFEDPEVAMVNFMCLSPKPSIVEEIEVIPYKVRIARYGGAKGCAMIRKRVLDEVGLYDERLGPPYGSHEDYELGLRISKRYKVLIDGTLTQIHLGSKKRKIDSAESRCFINSAKGRLKYYFTRGAETFHIILLNLSLIHI